MSDALSASGIEGLDVRTVEGRHDFASLKGWLEEVAPMQRFGRAQRNMWR